MAPTFMFLFKILNFRKSQFIYKNKIRRNQTVTHSPKTRPGELTHRFVARLCQAGHKSKVEGFLRRKHRTRIYVKVVKVGHTKHD